MSEQWMNDLNILTTFGAFGFYQYAEVTQIVLLNKRTDVVWNYFTDIHFSSFVKPMENARFLTEGPQSVNKSYTLIISKYTVSVESFKTLYNRDIEEQKWDYKDKQIDSAVNLDNVFSTTKKFVPCGDPAVAQYNVCVPVEKSLYGSDFLGNYYMLELFSNKNEFDKILSKGDKENIQEIIKKEGLIYDLVNLSDRIGNVICKFEQEIIRSKPKSLGNELLSYTHSLSEEVKHTKNLVVGIIQEHDNLIYKNEIKHIKIDPGKLEETKIIPMDCKNTIFILDADTGLSLFTVVVNYSKFSDYYAEIKPKEYYTLLAKKRKFKINSENIEIQLKNIVGFGDIYLSTEIEKVEKRQQKWRDKFLESQKFFKIYGQSGQDEEINDIRKIINNQIIWDLNEICLIDPYLSPKEILSTVFYCKKENIKVRCRTSIKNI